jgi:ABC-type Mn2+/Zn2+ transport system ATPase subunit
MPTPVVSFHDVTFSYGARPALENVTFSVDPREAVCVVGPNGGGKTTLVRLILGLLVPQRGEIRVFGQPPHRARLRIGYMPQHVQHDPQFPVTAMDIVLMGRLGQEAAGSRSPAASCGQDARAPESRSAAVPAASCGQDARAPESRSAAVPAASCGQDARAPVVGPRWQSLLGNLTGWRGQNDRRAAIDALELVGVAKLSRRPYASLSGGERQRVLIARALCCHPDLLLMDEPTSNVDTLVEGQLLDLLRKLNERMTIVMVSHDLGFVSALVNRVICVNRKVVIHRTSEMTGDAIRDIYGGDVRRVHHNGLSHR